MPALTDAALVGMVADGDRTALAELYSRHAPLLLARLRRRCSDAGLVEEVLQDAFLAVWTGAGRYDGRGPVAAWIWAIARRRLVDALRRRSRDLARTDELADDLGSNPSAEDEALATGAYGPVTGALGTLPEPLRIPLQLTVVDGLTTREAADVLGLPVGTVKTRCLRARSRLVAALQES